jgi:hypothetical protein
MKRQLCVLVDKKAKAVKKLQKIDASLLVMESLLGSPIFQFLCELFVEENIASIAYGYIGITFCTKHNSHYPHEMINCFGCVISRDSMTHRMMYKFRGPFIIQRATRQTKERHVKVADKDEPFRLHLLETLPPRSMITYECVNNECHDLMFMQVGNCWDRYYEIRDSKENGSSWIHNIGPRLTFV